MKLENGDVLTNVMKALQFVCAQDLSQVHMYILLIYNSYIIKYGST